jgi:hypothetical protein
MNATAGSPGNPLCSHITRILTIVLDVSFSRPVGSGFGEALPAFENQSKDDRYDKYPEAQHLVNKIEANAYGSGFEKSAR